MFSVTAHEPAGSAVSSTFSARGLSCQSWLRALLDLRAPVSKLPGQQNQCIRSTCESDWPSVNKSAACVLVGHVCIEWHVGPLQWFCVVCGMCLVHRSLELLGLEPIETACWLRVVHGWCYGPKITLNVACSYCMWVLGTLVVGVIECRLLCPNFMVCWLCMAHWSLVLFGHNVPVDLAY